MFSLDSYISHLQVKVFWIVMPCLVMVGYKHYMTPQPRRPWLESSVLWKPQISQDCT